MDHGTKSREQLIQEVAVLHDQLVTSEEREQAVAWLQDTLDAERVAHQERTKELNCLLAISSIVETPGITLERIFQETVELMVAAWQYPEATGARITCDELDASSAGFCETDWRLAHELKVHGRRAGTVEVCYLEEHPPTDEGPFLREERELLVAIAERMGRVVERFRAEEALRRSQATLRALLDAPPDVVTALTDAQGVVLEANEAMARRLGTTRADLIGTLVWERLEPEVANARRARFEEVVATGRPARFDDEREGRWFAHAVHPIQDDQGQVHQVAVMARDITGRMQAEWERDSAMALLEQAHRELEARIEERTTMLSDTVTVLRREIQERDRAESTLGRVNRRLRMLIECGQAVMRASSETELLAQVCDIVVQVGGYRLAWVGYAQDDEFKSVLPVVQAGFEEGYLEGLQITWADTERGRGPTGRAIRSGQPASARHIQTDPAFEPWRAEATKRGYASSLALPLMSGDKAFGSLNVYASEPDAFGAGEAELLGQLAQDLAFGVMALRDRKQRQRAEAALNVRVEELGSLYNIARQLSATVTPEELLEISLDAVFDLFKPDLSLVFLREGQDLHLAGSRAAEERHALKETAVHAVGECLCGLAVRDGEPIYAIDIHDDPRCTWQECKSAGLRSVAVLPLRSGETVLGSLLLGTAEPHVFEERGSFLEAIADQVAIALNSAQLAGEAAELEILRELNRLRSELLANVSHEIRTPLGLIEVLASSLRMEDVELDAVTQEEFLAGIAEETQRLKALVNNLLNLSQVESGTLRPFLEAVDLNRLARSRARTFQGQTTEHLLLVEMPSEPLLAQVDEREVDQVFTNLLGNAIRYSPDGGTIRIGGRREGDRILLSVADEGAGILPEEQEQIFDRFYRGESELASRVGGVGLGLAVCKGIVESYGGRIWVDSTPGLGSTFHFTLPAVEGP